MHDLHYSTTDWFAIAVVFVTALALLKTSAIVFGVGAFRVETVL